MSMVQLSGDLVPFYCVLCLFAVEGPIIRLFSAKDPCVQNSEG